MTFSRRMIKIIILCLLGIAAFNGLMVFIFFDGANIYSYGVYQWEKGKKEEAEGKYSRYVNGLKRKIKAAKANERRQKHENKVRQLENKYRDSDSIPHIAQTHSEERLGAWRSSSPRPYNEIRLDEDKIQFKATLFVAVDDSSIIQNEDSLKTMIRKISWQCMKDKFPRATLVIAILSRKKDAHPKRDDEIKTWKADYLARYDAWEKELIFYPENPKKRRKISFDLCPDAKETSIGFYHDHCQGKKYWEK